MSHYVIATVLEKKVLTSTTTAAHQLEAYRVDYFGRTFQMISDAFNITNIKLSQYWNASVFWCFRGCLKMKRHPSKMHYVLIICQTFSA